MFCKENFPRKRIFKSFVNFLGKGLLKNGQKRKVFEKKSFVNNFRSKIFKQSFTKKKNSRKKFFK